MNVIDGRVGPAGGRTPNYVISCAALRRIGPFLPRVPTATVLRVRGASSPSSPFNLLFDLVMPARSWYKDPGLFGRPLYDLEEITNTGTTSSTLDFYQWLFGSHAYFIHSLSMVSQHVNSQFQGNHTFKRLVSRPFLQLQLISGLRDQTCLWDLAASTHPSFLYFQSPFFVSRLFRCVSKSHLEFVVEFFPYFLGQEVSVSHNLLASL